MKRIAKWIAIVLVVLLLAVAALALMFDANRFRPDLEARLSAALNRDVKLGNLSLSIFSGSVEANDLSIADDAEFSKSPFLRAKAVRVAVELQPLIFSHKLNVTGITIEKPEIMLMQKPSGEWNFSSLGTPAKSATAPTKAASTSSTPSTPSTPATSSMDLSVKQLNITGGSLTFGRTAGNWKPLVLEQLNIEVRNFSSAAAFPYSFSTKVKGGGDIKLDGTAGPLNSADASMTPVTARLNITALDIAATGLANYAPEVAGFFSIDGTAESNGITLKANGGIKAEKLLLAKGGTPATVPVEFKFDLDHNLQKHFGTLKHGDIHIGKAAANLSGRYAEQGQTMSLNMNLDGPNMPVTEIANMLAPLGIVLPSGSSLQGGTISAKLSMEGPADKLVTNGTIAVRDTALAGFDLGKKMSLIQQLAGMNTGPTTEIQNASAAVHVAPEGIQASDIQLNVPAIGDLRGTGTISPANALAFKMSASLHTSGVAVILANKSIPFFVEGTSSNPQFKPDLKTLATEQVQAVKGTAASAAGNLLKGFLGGKK